MIDRDGSGHITVAELREAPVNVLPVPLRTHVLECTVLNAQSEKLQTPKNVCLAPSLFVINFPPC